MIKGKMGRYEFSKKMILHYFYALEQNDYFYNIWNNIFNI